MTFKYKIMYLTTPNRYDHLHSEVNFNRPLITKVIYVIRKTQE